MPRPTKVFNGAGLPMGGAGCVRIAPWPRALCRMATAVAASGPSPPSPAVPAHAAPPHLPSLSMTCAWQHQQFQNNNWAKLVPVACLAWLAPP